MKELINVPGLKSEDVVVIKKYTYGEQAKLSSKIAKVSVPDIKSGKTDTSVDTDIYAAQIYPLVYGIFKAPFIVPGSSEQQRVNAIEELDPDTGKFLSEEIKKLNNKELTSDAQKK